MKRFWKNAELNDAAGGWQVSLDGRSVKTRAGAPQIVPTKALGELLRAEWADAPQEGLPEHLPLRDLADRAIDTISSEPEPVITPRCDALAPVWSKLTAPVRFTALSIATPSPYTTVAPSAALSAPLPSALLLPNASAPSESVVPPV